MWCSQNDVATIRLSENFVYDVLAHFSVHDVVALNTYIIGNNLPFDRVQKHLRGQNICEKGNICGVRLPR